MTVAASTSLDLPVIGVVVETRGLPEMVPRFATAQVYSGVERSHCAVAGASTFAACVGAGVLYAYVACVGGLGAPGDSCAMHRACPIRPGLG